jgi:glycerophosphoryl diester phosphodiesterase
MAVDAGADGIEIDVRLTRDGVPVVIHDGSLWRTAGLKKRIAEMDYAELVGVDVGSWFNVRHRRRAVAAFADERVPRLADVLDLLSGYKGLLYIELKCRRRGRIDLVDEVCRTIAQSPLLPQMIVKSFDLDAVARAKETLPQVQTAALFGPDLRRVFKRRRRIVHVAHVHSADQLSLHYSLVTRSLMDAAGAAGRPVTVWTVDHRRRMRRLQALGIKALITNNPARMSEARPPSEPPASAGAEPGMSVPPAVAGG